MPRLTPLFTSLLVAGLLSGGIASAAEPTTLMKARINAVSVAKAGHLDEGIARLEALHQSNPKDAYVTADLIVLLRLAGQNKRIAELTKQMNPDDIPDYARLDLAHALRDEKQFERARTVLADHRQALGVSAQILYAMVTLEAGYSKEATEALPDRHTKGLRPVDLADMAYVWRRAGHPIDGLILSERALKLSPHQPQALREYVFALSDLGAAGAALKHAEQNQVLFSPDEMDRLVGNITAVHIRDAVQERRRLDDRYQYQKRDIPLDAALKSLQANRLAFRNDPVQELRTRYDQIYVLRTLELMPQAIKEYESLPQHPTTASGAELNTIPVYVRVAAADAYLYLRHPRRAAALYEDLIAENPKTEVERYTSLYYAYLDSEQYGKAEKILTLIHKVTPTWLGARYTTGNSERLDVDQIWAMDAAYRNNEAIGYKRMNELVNRAPRNAGLLNAKATLERWRGWPELSMQTTEIAAAYAPKSKDTRINIANNNRDLEHFSLWGRQIESLAKDFPTDSGIQKSLAWWHDRQSPSISSEYATGQSRGGGNPVAGNRDQDWQSRLSSAWTDGGWRAYIDQHYIWADYPEGALSYNRVGAGAEWRGDRKHAWLTISNDQLTGQHVGVAVGWSQWLNDHWQYVITGNSYSLDTPLRAKGVGLSGKSIKSQVSWKNNESSSAYAGLSLLAISDDNKRVDFSSGMTQRLFASPHHITSAGADVFAEHNSRPGGAYFNPANSESASVRLEHLWITWRTYERSFTQYFKASTGYGWQANFGGHPSVDLFYEHKWTFSRTWGLHYGIGWASNVYDGKREHRLYGLIGFGGVF